MTRGDKVACTNELSFWFGKVGIVLGSSKHFGDSVLWVELENGKRLPFVANELEKVE